MVNASLNWASICGLVLILTWIPLIAITINSITRLSSSSRDFPIRLINLLGLLGIPPICGSILFFQGWRLDPILQFGQFLFFFQVVTQQLVLIFFHKKNDNYSKSKSNTASPIKIKTKKEEQYDEILSELATLEIWKNKDLITEEEFEAKKKKLLDL